MRMVFVALKERGLNDRSKDNSPAKIAALVTLKLCRLAPPSWDVAARKMRQGEGAVRGRPFQEAGGFLEA